MDFLGYSLVLEEGLTTSETRSRASPVVPQIPGIRQDDQDRETCVNSYERAISS